MASVAAAKSALRKAVKAAIKALPMEARAQESIGVQKQVIASAAYQKAKRVCVYMSMPSEVDTQLIIEDVFSSGRECFIPYYDVDKMDMYKVHSLDELESLPLTEWNIRQHANTEGLTNALDTGGLDLIVVPGLAFSKDGNRLGRGKGYYDKYITRCEKAMGTDWEKTSLIGLSFSVQEAAQIPVSEFDVPLHHIFFGEMEE